jgi:hypothetical protein
MNLVSVSKEQGLPSPFSQTKPEETGRNEKEKIVKRKSS